MPAAASTTTEVLEAQNEQREGAKRATLDQLLGKKRAQQEVIFRLDKDAEPVSLLFVAISSTDYDRLLAKCPPTQDQKAEGATYDPDKFAPVLLSRVCIEPALSEEDWRKIWKSEDWSRGEAGDLFFGAVQLCNRGLDVGPTAAG